MYAIRFGTTEEWMRLEDVRASRIADQINRRRKDGASVCFQVKAQYSATEWISFQSPACPSTGYAGGRPLSALEKRIQELWNEKGLNNPNITVGGVESFVNELRRL